MNQNGEVQEDLAVIFQLISIDILRYIGIFLSHKSYRYFLSSSTYLKELKYSSVFYPLKPSYSLVYLEFPLLEHGIESSDIYRFSFRQRIRSLVINPSRQVGLHLTTFPVPSVPLSYYLKDLDQDDAPEQAQDEEEETDRSSELEKEIDATCAHRCRVCAY